MSKQFYTNLVNPNLEYNASNGTVNNPMTATLDAAENSIINLPNPSTNGEPITLGYWNENMPDLSGTVTNPLTADIDCAGNALLNVGYLSVKDAINTLNTYYVQLENGGVVTSNVSDASSSLLHIAINEFGTSKPYYTDFRSHPITNVGSLGFPDGGTISKSSDKFVLNQPLDMQNYYITNVQNLAFFGGGSLDCDGQDNLVYNSDIVVTAANINTYIAEANWEPTAGSNLEMGQYSINFDGGSIYPNQQLGLSAAYDSTLTYGGQTVVTRNRDVLTTYTFTELTPGGSPNVNVAGGYPMGLCSTGISSGNAELDNPIFDIRINLTIDEGNDIDRSTAYIIIGVSDDGNPVTSDHTVEYLKINGPCLSADGSGNYYTRICSDEANPHVTVVTEWASVWTTLTTSSGFFYMSMYAENTGSANVYVPNFQASINVVADTNDKDFYVSIDSTKVGSGLVPVNNSTCAIQTYQYLENVSQANGVNDLMTVILPSTTQTFLLKSSVVCPKFCVKSTCCVNGSGVISGTASSQVMFNVDNTLQDIEYQFRGGNIVIVTTLQARDIYNNATVKVKLLAVNDE